MKIKKIVIPITLRRFCDYLPYIKYEIDDLLDTGESADGEPIYLTTGKMKVTLEYIDEDH